MREWSGCASRALATRAGFRPPPPARVLAMATTSGPGIGATFSRKVIASGGLRTVFELKGNFFLIRRSYNPAFVSPASGVHRSRALRVANGFSNARCEAASARTRNQVEQSENQTEVSYSGEDVSWKVFKEGAVRRLAGVFIGSALLVASLGLGVARPALARTSSPPPSTQSEEATELNAGDFELVDGSEEELESTPAKEGQEEEEEKDPAELVLLSYLTRHPEDVKTMEGLLYVRLRNGRIAKALETVDKLLELRPDHTPWQLIRAQSLEFLGDLDAARHAFVAILETDPLSARALQGLATVMSKAGEGMESLEMLQRAVQTAMDAGKMKESKNIRMLLGQMYTVQGHLQEALAQYQELEQEDPRDFRPYLCQGLVYSLLEQKADAEKAFQKYRRRCPKTFPERGYLDDLMIGAKTEARRQLTQERTKPIRKGKKKPKPLQQPRVLSPLSDTFDGEEEELEEEDEPGAPPY